jgi:molybdopterin-guanine dinucleotide biosynthesis protein
MMIVADTWSVNTGKKTDLVVRLHQMFEEKGYPKPKFISCQHHELDCVLRVFMDDELHWSTKSPNDEYFFVQDLMSN